MVIIVVIAIVIVIVLMVMGNMIMCSWVMGKSASVTKYHYVCGGKNENERGIGTTGINNPAHQSSTTHIVTRSELCVAAFRRIALISPTTSTASTATRGHKTLP